jgi:hypothetical protein
VLAEGRPERDHGLRVASSHPVRVGDEEISAGVSTLPIEFSGPDHFCFVNERVILRQE